VAAAACVLKTLVFRAHWPLKMKAVGFLETAGRVKLFLCFFYSFSFSHNFVFLTFPYIILTLFLLPCTPNVFFAFCSIYLFSSLSFSPLYHSILYLLYPFTFVIYFFFNILFLIEFCKAARDLKRCSKLSWLYLHYIVWECSQFMLCMSHWINSRFLVILNH